MIGYSIRFVFRIFSRKKFFFIINLLGISVGIAAFTALYLYTNSEKRYDQFHSKADQIFRIKASRFHKNILSREMVGVTLAAGPSIQESFEEVLQHVQLFKVTSLIRYKHDWFKTEQSCYASKDFFKLFSFPLLKGNDSLVLSRPFTAAISQSFAEKIFGDEDPIGKSINYKGRFDYEITGVFEDMPANSHMNFELILSFESYRQIVSKTVLEEPWRWDGYVTYLLLRKGASAQSLEEKIPRLIEEKTGDWLRNSDQRLELSLQPLKSIHLNSNYNGELSVNGDGKLIFYLELIALCILLLAWINYISLATAKSLDRAREVGVKKALGGNRAQLVIQFLAESLLLNFMALGVAIIIIAVIIIYDPEYGSVIRQFDLLSWQQWIGLLLILLVGSFLSGIYPALVLSRFNPAIVLKSSFSKTVHGAGVRKVLVVIQFACSLVLVIWIYAAGKQLQHLRNQPLGFQKQARLVVRDSEVYDSLYNRSVQSFKNEVVRLAGVHHMSYIETLPGERIRTYANGVRRMKADTSDVNSFNYVRVDENFVDVFGLNIIAGRNFLPSSTGKEVLVNELALKLLGYANPEQALQEEIYFRDDTVRVIGVLQNFYFNSPKSEMIPIIFQFNNRSGNYYILSVSSSRDVIDQTEKLFSTMFPGQPFLCHFLDDHYNLQYASDQKFEQALHLFSGISIWIACLGLIGMAAYSATVRKKEISIRKVLGSSSLEILKLLWRDYFKSIGVASLLAIPASWLVVEWWLEDYAVKITIQPQIFILPIMFLFMITFITIGLQTIKAALVNPIEGIKHE